MWRKLIPHSWIGIQNQLLICNILCIVLERMNCYQVWSYSIFMELPWCLMVWWFVNSAAQSTLKVQLQNMHLMLVNGRGPQTHPMLLGIIWCCILRRFHPPSWAIWPLLELYELILILQTQVSDSFPPQNSVKNQFNVVVSHEYTI